MIMVLKPRMYDLSTSSVFSFSYFD